MKGKKAGLQARFLQITSKALHVSCANHSLNLVLVNSARCFTEASLFVWMLTPLYVHFLIFHSTLDHTKNECAATTQIAVFYLLREPDTLHLTFAIPFG